MVKKTWCKNFKRETEVRGKKPPICHFQLIKGYNPGIIKGMISKLELVLCIMAKNIVLNFNLMPLDLSMFGGGGGHTCFLSLQ